MFRWMLALALAGAPWIATAQSEAEVRAQAVASMIVTGRLDVEPDGSVSALALDRQEALPRYVVDAVGKVARGWLFEPEIRDGAAIAFRVRISMRVLATPTADDGFTISVANASLVEEAPRAQTITGLRMPPPSYPKEALQRDASAVAYLVVKVDREGRVVDSAVEQVNLRASAPGRLMAILREEFSKHALKASRKWTFQPPTEGEHAADPFWSVRVPVSFFMHGTADMDQYGRWMAYIPGPRQQAPWLEGVALDANDALGDGEMQLVGTGPRLRTPLQPAG